jgi:hypothetical protein
LAGNFVRKPSLGFRASIAATSVSGVFNSSSAMVSTPDSMRSINRRVGTISLAFAFASSTSKIACSIGT